MHLYGSLTSPFVRKVRVVLAESGATCTFVPGNPRLEDSVAQARNPSGKVPLLITDAGKAIYDSRVIVEYLDAIAAREGRHRVVPAEGDARWDALRLQALGDQLIESTIKLWLFTRDVAPTLAKDAAPPASVAWDERRIGRMIAALDRELSSFDAAAAGADDAEPLGIAAIAIGVALEYLDLRVPNAWRSEFPALDGWMRRMWTRPSFVATRLDAAR